MYNIPPDMLFKTGFPPLADTAAKVLVLGSMPGEVSLSEQQYYAHPRNLFWTFMTALAGRSEVPVVYAARRVLLAELHIALWDVCGSCLRQGSLDTAIRAEVPNDIGALLAACPGIRLIAFNGQKAAQLYRKHFVPDPGMLYLQLPSTSPANAGQAPDAKLDRWLELRKWI